jgi:hypothetical protein
VLVELLVLLELIPQQSKVLWELLEVRPLLRVAILSYPLMVEALAQ